MSGTIVRVYRSGWATWWAELWRVRLPSDAPEPRIHIEQRGRARHIPGMVRVDIALRSTRFGARRAGRQLQRRYLATGTTAKDLHEEILW